MTRNRTHKQTVSLPALVARINRQLAKEGEQLKKARGARAVFELGEYYAMDTNRNFISAKHVDPETWGREMGVLSDHEVLDATG